jgi:hypothetical protein
VYLQPCKLIRRYVPRCGRVIRTGYREELRLVCLQHVNDSAAHRFPGAFNSSSSVLRPRNTPSYSSRSVAEARELEASWRSSWIQDGTSTIEAPFDQSDEQLSMDSSDGDGDPPVIPDIDFGDVLANVWSTNPTLDSSNVENEEHTSLPSPPVSVSSVSGLDLRPANVDRETDTQWRSEYSFQQDDETSIQYDEDTREFSDDYRSDSASVNLGSEMFSPSPASSTFHLPSRDAIYRGVLHDSIISMRRSQSSADEAREGHDPYSGLIRVDTEREECYHEEPAGDIATRHPIYECPLCFDKRDNLSCVPCGHVFCTECVRTVFNFDFFLAIASVNNILLVRCIRHALRVDRRCPLCRKSAVISELRRIYLSTGL